MDKSARILSGVRELAYGDPSSVCYIGAVMRLMEYVGDPIQEEELIALSGVGLCFPWKFGSDCDEVTVIAEIPARTFDALGYESEYYSEEIRKDDLVPGAWALGRWPLPHGTYDPLLDNLGIPDGARVYQLYDARYGKMAVPDAVDGYRLVGSPSELGSGTWCVLHAPSGLDYVLVACDKEEEAQRRTYSKDFYIEKIRQSIDAGRPVIGFGLTTDTYSSLITGYYDGGEGLFIRSCWPQGNSPRGYYTLDWYDRCRGILVVGEKTGRRVAGEAAYKVVVDWARWARGARMRPATANGVTYPLGEAAFTEMGQWLMDDEQWRTITSHEAFLKQSGLLLVGYYRNNLRSYLERLDAQYPGVVNPAALVWLRRMSQQFPGSHASDLWLSQCVDSTITEFGMLRDRSIREKMWRYVKDNVAGCDNCIQWTLFMPDYVRKQIADSGVSLRDFRYLTLPAMRFIGLEAGLDRRKEIMDTLDSMTEYASGFDCDVVLMHHYGKGVGVSDWHGFLGRFMKADASVPHGYVHFDFVPDDRDTPYLTFRSQFAFAVFAGTRKTLHKVEGFDSDLMYDITRNTILGDGVTIPYPEAYWTAEVLSDRADGTLCQPRHPWLGETEPDEMWAGYLFSVYLDNEKEE